MRSFLFFFPHLWNLLIMSFLQNMLTSTGAYNIFFTDTNLKRFGGFENTFNEPQFTELIRDFSNVVFIPVNNGKVYFTSIFNEQSNNIKYEPLMITSNDFHLHFASFLEKIFISSNHDYSPHDFDVNEIYTYIGMKRSNHYISIELSLSQHLDPINNANNMNTCIDIDNKLNQYAKFKSNSNNNINETFKLISCNLRKIVNEYYEDDISEDKQYSTMLALAGGFSSFHCSTRYCRKCGSKTKNNKCGNSRACINLQCKAKSYPRVEPATIMLIESRCRNYCLLGRKSEWKDGCYSTLAGFTELGEPLEQTVIREVFEESGVQVQPESVQYIVSQPWLFPSSLMIGFQAMAAAIDSSDTSAPYQLPIISFNQDEMQDVRWFAKDTVRMALRKQFGHDSLGSSTLAAKTTTYSPPSISNEYMVVPNNSDIEEKLNFPGATSLSRVLISNWCLQT